MSIIYGGKFKRVAIAIAVAGMIAGTQACSSQSSNQSPPPVTTASAPAAQAQPPAQAQDDQPDSVLGAGAHFVWTVVAFPFRVVGDVLGLLV